MANNLLFKIVNETTAAKCQAIAGGAAAVKRDTVDGAGIVDVDGVAVRRSAVGNLGLFRKAGQDI